MLQITSNTGGEHPARIGLNLWTQKEAAQYLGVSPRYLRASSCPKLLLPGTGAARKALVRYAPKDVCEWAVNHSSNRMVA
jgi:hypothetical protein